MSDKAKDDRRHIGTAGGVYIEGEVHTAGGDLINRDKIVYAIEAGANATIQIIHSYKERELTDVELDEQAEAHDRRMLADGVAVCVERLGRQAAAKPLSPRANPYKALLEYDLQDAALFYGRTAAFRQLLAHLQRGKLTVLYSGSGTGKTSLLKAGLMPQLLAVDQVPLYVRPRGTLVQLALKRALLKDKADLPRLANASLLDFLHHVTELLGGQTVVVAGVKN